MERSPGAGGGRRSGTELVERGRRQVDQRPGESWTEAACRVGAERMLALLLSGDLPPRSAGEAVKVSEGVIRIHAALRALPGAEPEQEQPTLAATSARFHEMLRAHQQQGGAWCRVSEPSWVSSPRTRSGNRRP